MRLRVKMCDLHVKRALTYGVELEDVSRRRWSQAVEQNEAVVPSLNIILNSNEDEN